MYFRINNRMASTISSTVVVEKLSEGGQATIFTHSRDSTVFQIEKRYKQQAKEMSEREFAMSHRVTSTHIVDVKKTDEHSLLMPHYPLGDCVKYYLSEHGAHRFEESDAFEMIKQLSPALQRLSDANVCHRDITPSNILLSTEGNGAIRYLLTDFGLAIDLKSEKPSSCGTHIFAAPESLEQTPRFTRNSDVFSLGVVVLYLLRRNHPLNLQWDGLKDGADAAAQRARGYLAKYNLKRDFSDADISTTRLHFSRPFVTLLRRMLRFNPDRRCSFAVVVEFSLDPVVYEMNRENDEVNLAAQKRLTTSQTIQLAELAKQLETNGQLLVSAEARARDSEANRDATQTKFLAAQSDAENAHGAFHDAQVTTEGVRNSYLRQLERVETLEKLIKTHESVENQLRDERVQLLNGLDAANSRVIHLELSTASERIEYERQLTASTARIADLESQHASTIAQLDAATRKSAELESAKNADNIQLDVTLKKVTALTAAIEATKQHAAIQAGRIVCTLNLSFFSFHLL